MNDKHDDKILHCLKLASDFQSNPETVDNDLDAVRELLTQQKTKSKARNIMNNNWMKFSIAAVAFIAVGMVFVFNGESGMAWAEVIENLQQTKNFSYHINIDTEMELPESTQLPPTASDMEGDVIISEDIGVLMEMRSKATGEVQQQMYLNYADKKMTTVMPSAKTYMIITLTDDMLENMKKKGNDPRYMFEQLGEANYVEIGEDVIDGIAVTGIESNDTALLADMYEKLSFRLWANAENGNPVRMEMEMEMKNPAFGTMKMKMVMDDFQWDIEVNPDIFVAEIPEGYSSMGNIELPSPTMEVAIKGLKAYCEVIGAFPEKLNAVSMPAKYSQKLAEKLALELEDKEAQADLMKNHMEETKPLLGLAMFVMQIKQEKRDFKYYGVDVEVGNADAVIMSWRLDDGSYQLIFGDLHTDTVTEETLQDMTE